jgi:glucose-6-phosphate 1-dehydrogenase
MTHDGTTPSGIPTDRCILVIFGASGDLTRRLLVPALYNLAADGLLDRLAVLGVSLADLDDASFREKLGRDLQTFTTRSGVDPRVWENLERQLYYERGGFEDEATYARLATRLETIGSKLGTNGNVVFYLATPPAFFGLIAGHLARAGLHRHGSGWRRLIVEKPFGRDLDSAVALNRALLAHWDEQQIFRIDHYLGKETVQNLLAFRFSNGMFEPLWSRQQICHIQFTVAESVGVEGRGSYYETAGALRDMIQNHMFQMVAYLCMEAPSSMGADAVRNEKAKVLESVRIMTPAEVLRDTVRGQYGPGRQPDGAGVPGYRQEPDVDPGSVTETFAALRLAIDNWRWEGVPIYLRSGKRLWKKGTEILVQFKRAPEVLFRGTPSAGHLENNQLIFHVQPDQAIELRFQAKRPGPRLELQKVDMRFDYDNAFEAGRSNGYEVLLYQCMRGDATLFTRNDLVEAAWRITQPILDTWAENLPGDFPNYEANTWGPKAAFDLLARDGREWLEIINRHTLAQVPLFAGTSPVFLQRLTMVLQPAVFETGDVILRKGDLGTEMFLLARGEVEVLDGDGQRLNCLGPGSFFGELALLSTGPRRATVRALTHCDLYALDKVDLQRVLRDHPRFARSILDVCRDRYQLDLASEQAFGELIAAFVEKGT